MDSTVRHQILQGPSLYALRPVVIGWLVVFAIALVTVLADAAHMGTRASQPTLNAFTAVWGVAIGIGLLGALLGIVAKVRSEAERAAGYTTTPFGFPEVDLVDPRTGIVLRNAGEPLLDKRTFLDRRRQARLVDVPS